MPPIARAVAFASLALAAQLPAQAVRLRTVYGTSGAVSVGSVGDTVWLSIRTWNGDLFTMRADSETIAAWADSPTLINDQAITFTPGSPDSLAGYFVHAAQGTRPAIPGTAPGGPDPPHARARVSGG